MRVSIINEDLYKGGKDNPHYPATVDMHYDKGIPYTTVGAIREAGINPMHHCKFGEGDDARMALFNHDWRRAR